MSQSDGQVWGGSKARGAQMAGKRSDGKVEIARVLSSNPGEMNS